MIIRTNRSPMTTLGIALAMIGMILYPHLTWLAAIGVGIVIGSYIEVDIEEESET